jgi:hypothetical protein
MSPPARQPDVTEIPDATEISDVTEIKVPGPSFDLLGIARRD